MSGGCFGGGRMPASADVASWRVERRDATASTNLDVLERARAGDPGRLWITAERQLDGRARRGRSWISEAGNLYASALLIDPCAPTHLPELPFVAALAAADAIGRHLGPERGLGIKWPNDVLIAGRKVAGILLETTRTPAGVTAVAVGIGINCRHWPPATETPATSLLAEGADVAPERLHLDLVAALADRLALWDCGEGFAEIRAAWLARAVGLGRRIRVRLVAGEDEGVFAAIDAAGHLILARDDGTRRSISAGDVFVMPAPSEE